MDLEGLALKIRTGINQAGLFGSPPSETAYRKMRSILHPDRCSRPDAGILFHALARIWEGHPNPFASTAAFSMPLKEGGRLDAHAQEISEISIGLRVMTPHAVGLLFRKEHADLIEPYYGSCLWHFASEEMEKQCRSGPDGFLPRTAKRWNGADGSIFASVAKRPEAVPLDTLLRRYGGSLDLRHIAWILSGLYNALCYFEFAGIAHLGLEPSAVMVEPSTHRVSIPGGWAHTVPAGEKPRLVPIWVANALPRRYRGSKKAEIQMSAELVRAIGRQLFGDPSGIKLAKEKQTLVVKHLLGSAEGSAVDQYQEWRDATASAFNGHHFHKMDADLVADPTIVYQEKR